MKLRTMPRAIAALIMALFCAVSVYGQKKESLALLPFTGGDGRDGEAIVSELARQRVLRDAFEKVTLVTSTTQGFMQFEQKFQRTSGLTDADTVFEVGRNLNAAFVIAGYITRFGDRNLVLVSILDVESLQQIAGDYRTYKTIEEIDGMIPDIARKLAAAVPRDTSKLPGLSVPPFALSQEVNANDSQVLAQILATELANGSKYAVLPRTDSLQTVLDEHQRERSGETDQTRVKKLGAGRNAQYVLAGSVEKLGTLNKFATDILNIEDGSFMDGYSERYSAFTEGYDLMPKLATSLMGTPYDAPTPPAALAAQAPLAQPAPVIAASTDFVKISGGTFMMGSPVLEVGRGDNETQHRVTVSDFYMGKHEVTQVEYQAIMGNNPSNWKGDNLPVEQVSWFDAVEYCNKRSVKEGLRPAYTVSGTNVTWDRSANGYRLPTEAEWEYACRAGTTTPFYTGSNITVNQANYDGTYPYNRNARGIYRAKTTTAGSFTPNVWGLYDMHGNVYEWCWDWYGGYSSAAQTDPTGASSSAGRVVRGGSWLDEGRSLRSAYRAGSTPSARSGNLGFRLIRPDL